MTDIKTIRSNLKLTQAQFSDKFGIPIRSLQKWESGEREAPEYTIDMLELLAEEDKANQRLAWFLIDKPRGKHEGITTLRGGAYISKLKACQDGYEIFMHRSAKEKAARKTMLVLCGVDENGCRAGEAIQEIEIKL